MDKVTPFVMMGRPGSGKGTQATLLAKKIGAEVYSSGNRLREMAKGQGFANQKIKTVFLMISDSEVEKRLSLRSGVEGRADDASDAVGNRIKEYEEKTAAAVGFFKSRGALLEINGEQPIEAVHADILKSLNLS